MAVRFFGQYLVDRGITTKTQLAEAVELQEKRHRPLGHYAVARGFLSAGQPDRIKARQRESGELFGDVAVEMGLLTRAQVDELLELQKKDHIRIGEALVELGHVDRDLLGRELSGFLSEQAESGAGVVFPGGDWDELLKAVLRLTQNQLLQLAGIKNKLGESRALLGPLPSELTVGISFRGRFNFDFVIGVSHEIARRIAAGLIGEADGEGLSTEEVVDSVRELCNIICGNSLGRFDLPADRTEISSPWNGHGNLSDADKGMIVTIHVVDGMSEGVIELALIAKSPEAGSTEPE